MKRKTVDVEEEWMMWNTILEEAFRQTVEQQLNDQEGREEEMDTKYTLEEEKKMKRAIKTKVHKGTKPKLQRKNVMRAHPDSSMQERKLRKWLGRAFGSYNRMRTGKTVEVETKEHQKVWGNRNMVKEMPEMPNESEKLTWIREASKRNCRKKKTKENTTESRRGDVECKTVSVK